MTDEIAEHRNEVKDRIRFAMSEGAKDFYDILVACEGADPRFVFACINELNEKETIDTTARASRDVVPQLPAPDPSRSQWWFAGETIESIGGRAASRIRVAGGQVVCLGAPSIGLYLQSQKVSAVVLDVDPDVVALVRLVHGPEAARAYDAVDELPSDLRDSCAVAVVDPPWYEVAANVFLARALSALRDGGELLMSLPPRLTRPGADRFRGELVDRLLKAGHEILSLERQTVLYLVPRFEEAALADGINFRGIPWRRADLLHLRKRSGALLEIKTPLERQSVRVFSRLPQEFRIFLGSRQTANNAVLLEPLDAYSRNISTRAHAGEEPDVWTTEKIGARTGKRELVEDVLCAWSDLTIRTQGAAAERLAEKYGGQAPHVVAEMDRVFGLWSRFATQPALRTDEEIAAKKQISLTEWALTTSEREHKHDGDKFRGDYQRDRDRILWAATFRKLGHKTQLFPSDHDDQTRQRLTHSIEVMQLASTISASFGLDRDLVEAGALAHDIGHTPFGHAGEHALHTLFNTIHSKLGGFNHYEHGVDVVRWLEGPYFISTTTSFHGLNLTSAVAECILKHTYCHDGEGLTTEELLRSGKHADYISKGYCHLEGQAVRIADKISYFVSDLEDGLRLGAITTSDLLSCHFFHRPPLNFQLGGRLSPYQSFLAQRRNILRILMEDVLVATSKRLARMTPDGVRKAGEYMVNHSKAMQHDVSEVWERLQVARLHEDRRVKLANLKATRIVSDLTLLFAASPGLVDADFSSEYARLRSSKYMKYYRDEVGKAVQVQPELLAFVPLERLIGFKHSANKSFEIPVEDLVMAKDFVAGLTDSRARKLHLELLGG